MKTNTSLLFAALIILPSVPLRAQSVVIEGGPDTVQISDRDGKPEPVTPGGPTGPNAVTRDEQTIPPALMPPQTPASNRPLSPAPAPARAMGPAGPAGTAPAAPGVAAPPRTLAVGEAKRIAELKRELGILDTGTSATLSLSMNNVFTDGAATVDALAVEKLTLIAEYLQLALTREVQLTYHYAPNLHDKDLAWSRSVAMIKWMTENGGLTESTFTIQNPKIVTEATPTSVPDDGALAIMENRIEFSVLFR